ncbi:hypothetical protein PHLCEN_2v10875 [Hermanssonia centrifuga]|uniref:ABC transmembrane type-1 domain-containing protein n=1 Tax=Hermanssonia centrifuga TaxID=98765 RepID=A0A2R6NLJ7_9APHY|nr:hypothetical protein PHLCEN_2v10875 [Hermanssonia centrifuga]
MASLHLTLVTFTLFAVYTYRDIWPLMTFTLEVADKDEGSILWVKIALVAFTGVVEPMFEPYPYIPVDHKVIITTCTHIRIGGIITSIVFDHALRIRLKAEVSDTKASSTTERVDIFTTSNTPDSGSTIANDNDEAEDSTTTHSKGVLSASASTTTVAAASSSTQAHSKAIYPEAKDAKQMENTLKSKGTNVVGKLNNLVTSDLDNIAKGCDFLMIFIYSPLQIALGIWFLYVILGWSTFVGLAVMVILFPAPAWIASLMGDVQKRKMESTDARVQNVVEVMNVLRMIKLFGWESRVIDDVSTKREDELRWIFKNKMLRLGIDIINMIPQMITANVSLERVADFLWNTELLDVFTKENASADPTNRSRDEIGCGHAHFTWTHEPATPSKQTFRLRIDDELAFKKGSFNLIIGPTGSGKTSILMALLGEMRYIPLGPDAWINLPRDGGVALAVQESWVQSETIRRRPEGMVFPHDKTAIVNLIVPRLGLRWHELCTRLPKFFCSMMYASHLSLIIFFLLIGMPTDPRSFGKLNLFEDQGHSFTHKGRTCIPPVGSSTNASKAI